MLVIALILLPFSTQLACAQAGLPQAASKLMVKLTREREGDVIRFFFENLESSDITATFEPGLVNMRGNTTFPYTVSCPPHHKIEAFSLMPVVPDSKWTYTLTNYFTFGNQMAVHDNTYLYALPYSPGESFLVSQAFGGGFSHKGAERYAIDWSMPEGTPVRAARAGIVVATRRDSRIGGPERRFENDSNFILVQHADRTIANYAHLMLDGVKVRAGQKVEVGEIIGYSGNTGFSSGPHLHLSVFKAADGRTRESIPIRFNMGDGIGTTLLAGRSYRNGSAPILASKAGVTGAQN